MNIHTMLRALGAACGLVLLGAGVVSLTAHTPTHAAPPAQDAPTCNTQLEGLWALATGACVAGAVGTVCNGGSSPQVEPQGPVEAALAAVGAQVAARDVQAVRTVPIITEVVGGGLVWVRPDASDVTMLLLGEGTLRDATPPGFPQWSSLVVETGDDRADCPASPHNTLLLQTPLTSSARVVVNGVSLDLNGTVAVRTIGQATVFLGLNGRSAVISGGATERVWTGLQSAVLHAEGDYTTPLTTPSAAAPLNPVLIAGLPTGLLDRPLWLPQPGYAFTSATVNLRARPALNGELILQVPANELLTIIGTDPSGEWLHVALGTGLSGWMFAELLERRTGPIAAVYSATPQPPARFGSINASGRIIAAAGVNLRAAPDVAFGIVGNLPNGAQVTLLARSPYSPWVKVRAAGQPDGWVSLLVVDANINVDLLPIDSNVPPPPGPTQIPGSFGNAFPDPNRRTDD